MTARIAISSGEPAGIGPDLCLALQDLAPDVELVVMGDPQLLAARAAQLQRPWEPPLYQPDRAAQAGRVCLAPVALARPAVGGRLDVANAPYVLELLDRAVSGCLQGEFQALVTAPVHKAVINDAGFAFTGHTEYLAEKCAADQVVMMLVAPGLRVALATTHLPLSQVAAAITEPALEAVLRCTYTELQRKFHIARPRVLVAGLNPHAGENGHLGHEERDIIEPVIARLQSEGLTLTGPLPADTLFTPPWLARADAVVAMYHDQGLPVLKHLGFGRAVNITLGLPIVRTSVDHGTALDKAGTGAAETGSLEAAIRCAIDLSA